MVIFILQLYWEDFLVKLLTLVFINCLLGPFLISVTNVYIFNTFHFSNQEIKVLNWDKLNFELSIKAHKINLWLTPLTSSLKQEWFCKRCNILWKLAISEHMCVDVPTCLVLFTFVKYQCA